MSTIKDQLVTMLEEDAEMSRRYWSGQLTPEEMEMARQDHYQDEVEISEIGGEN